MEYNSTKYLLQKANIYLWNKVIYKSKIGMMIYDPYEMILTMCLKKSNLKTT